MAPGASRDGQVTTVSGLAYNTTYYWQVRATNGGGATLANTGPWWSFTTRVLPAAFWQDFAGE